MPHVSPSSCFSFGFTRTSNFLSFFFFFLNLKGLASSLQLFLNLKFIPITVSLSQFLSCFFLFPLYHQPRSELCYEFFKLYRLCTETGFKVIENSSFSTSQLAVYIKSCVTGQKAIKVLNSDVSKLFEGRFCCSGLKQHFGLKLACRLVWPPAFGFRVLFCVACAFSGFLWQDVNHS